MISQKMQKDIKHTLTDKNKKQKSASKDMYKELTTSTKQELFTAELEGKYCEFSWRTSVV